MTPEEIMRQAELEVAGLPPLRLPGAQPEDTTTPVRDQIAVLAMTALPQEACGFVLTDGAVVLCTNVDPDPYQAFRIDPSEASAWWRTGRVAAVWHSHPTGPAIPSNADVRYAPSGCDTMIYSVEDEDLATYRHGNELIDMEGPQ